MFEPSTGYKIMLILHIIAVVVAFAPAFMSVAVVKASERDPKAGVALEVGVQRLALPAMVLAGLFGFGLVGMSDKYFSMSETWVTLASIVWIALVLVVALLARPAVKALAAGVEGARQKVMMSTGITHLLFVVMIYLMVFQPGH